MNNNNYTAEVSLMIDAPAEKVWQGLTDPKLVKEYFFGTDVRSDWKVGSSIEFTGSWEGKPYLDKGTILESEHAKLLRYNYISSMSGLEDKPENYANITYALEEKNGGTELRITQDHLATEEAREHSQGSWTLLLNQLKVLIEKN